MEICPAVCRKLKSNTLCLLNLQWINKNKFKNMNILVSIINLFPDNQMACKKQNWIKFILAFLSKCMFLY